ncbi:GNAT family N-acetyltransferase [Spirulina major]|uniref:GNAT family N-acetyltransferase n=1 Tax=Spirulina major TaxID=270636 RepID=UPI00093419D8|nr:GNAT family N-acetyltransferase [Spirulina major]
MGIYQVRFATEADAPCLVEIHNRNARGACDRFDRGFLLEPTSLDAVQGALGKGTRYLVAVNEGDRILGFVMIALSLLNPVLRDKITWTNPHIPAQTQRDNHRYIQILAVHPDVAGRGVARTLYESLPIQFPNTLFSAIVVWQPIQNQRSLQFHQRQGFIELGRLRAEQFLDLHNYEAIVIGKATPPATWDS